MKTSAKQLARGLFDEMQTRGALKTDAVADAFVRFLADRHELSRWREVVRALDVVWKDAFGVATVEIVSARDFTKELGAALEKKFAGASVTLRVDEGAIGGASVRIDDRVVDGTIRTRLALLKQALLI